MDVASLQLAPAIPAPVHEVLACLHRSGGRAWLVGGTVRDLLLGFPPQDFDVATDLPPDRVAALLGGADEHSRYGACQVPTAVGTVTVTTLRTDADYRDHRHPDRVQFVTEPAQDAVRRDFTCNALYLDPRSAELLDPCGGLEDLRQRQLRTIGDPVRRFAEDALRILRGWRFAARFGFTFDPATEAALRAAAADVHRLSHERVAGELTAAFTGPGRGRALRSSVELGLAAVVLPEVAAMDGVPQPPEYHPEGCVLTHACLVLDHVPAGDPVLAWSAVLHDVGKPPTFRIAEDRIRFDGHDVLSARMAEDVLLRLRAPKDLREAVVDVCRHHIRFASLPGMRKHRRQEWMRSPHFRHHLAFHRADCLGSHGKLDIWEAARAEFDALPPLAPPLVTGQDVLDLGVAPGPRVGELLVAVHEAAERSDAAMDRASALVLLRDLVERSRQGDSGPSR